MPQDDDDDLVKVAKATCKRLSEELQAQDQQYEEALCDLHAQKKEALPREARSSSGASNVQLVAKKVAAANRKGDDSTHADRAAAEKVLRQA